MWEDEGEIKHEVIRWKNIMYMYETVVEAGSWIWLSDGKCLVYTKPWVTGAATDEAGLKSPLLPKS